MTAWEPAHTPLAPRPRLSVVVPCYNEESVLPELARRLTAVCDREVGGPYEIVLVNDGSHDRTWETIGTIAETNPNIVGVNLSRNIGHQLALTAGLTVCRGDRVLIIDADLQDPPELLSQMMAAMDRGADVVYGQRLAREGEGVFKRATAFAFYRLLSIFSEVEIPKDSGDFRLMTRQVVDALNRMPERHRFIRGMVVWLGFRQVPLQYTREPRFAGATRYPLRKMARFAAAAITGFSISPPRWTWTPAARRGWTPVDEHAVLLTAGTAGRLMRDAGLQVVDTRYFLYVPQRLYRWAGAVERALARVPLGGQYSVFGMK